MIDICMALDQSVSLHTGVRTIQNTGVFWQAVLQPSRPYSLFLEHGSAAKTLISHPHSTASYAGYIKAIDHTFYGFNGVITYLECLENTRKACKLLVFGL